MNPPRVPAKPRKPVANASPEAAHQLWLMQILDAAIAKVPSVKYALGVAGVFVVVAIVVTLSVDLRVAVFGTLVTFGFMVVLLVFAKLAAAGPKMFVAPAAVLLWAFTVLSIAASVLLVTSVFFRYPVDLEGWLRPGASAAMAATPAASANEAAAAPSLAAVLAAAAPPAPAAHAAALAVDVRLFARRAGAPGPAPLSEGEALATNDDFCIVISPATAGYLYVLQQDAAGHVQWLFPAHDGAPFASGSNPVVARLPLTLPPDAGGMFFLDSTVGTETVVIAFSATPWPALESALRAQAGPHPAAPVPDLARLATFRGIGGMRRIAASSLGMPPAADKRLDGRTWSLPAPSELQSADDFLVLRRSFQHVPAPH